ncbi:MAG: FAD-dependent oxidoreductase [Coriobacteriia bacterium]|nr:FAD-dependent oxidoreductase [Coriobacteriia bacterium]
MTIAETPKDLYDVVIIGAGPAGLTAGMYCARAGLSTAIVAGKVGGQASWAHKIENFIGWNLISGPELVERFRAHVGQFEVDCFEGQLVNALIPGDGIFELFTREGLSFRAHTVIIATGRARNKVTVPGENELLGAGVSYCATCDGAFFIGKPVAVIGSEEMAADAALQLSTLGAGPVILLGASAIKAPETVLAHIEADPNLSVRTGVKLVGIEGETKVTGARVKILATGEEEVIPVTGVFIETGAIPAADFTSGMIATNDKGEIVVDCSNATNVTGIYAAGDVTNGFAKQIIVAAGEGARAAMAVSRDLKRR